MVGKQERRRRFGESRSAVQVSISCPLCLWLYTFVLDSCWSAKLDVRDLQECRVWLERQLRSASAEVVLPMPAAGPPGVRSPRHSMYVVRCPMCFFPLRSEIGWATSAAAVVGRERTRGQAFSAHPQCHRSSIAEWGPAVFRLHSAQRPAQLAFRESSCSSRCAETHVQVVLQLWRLGSSPPQTLRATAFFRCG